MIIEAQKLTGSKKAAQKLQREKLEEENKLLRAKTEALQSAQHIEELYADAIKAMKSYSGYSGNEESYDTDI